MRVGEAHGCQHQKRKNEASLDPRVHLQDPIVFDDQTVLNNFDFAGWRPIRSPVRSVCPNREMAERIVYLEALDR